ncbi:MAG: hypothetical protein MUF51_05380, partial [Vicinamibacteria bacterium]|nr:hypothetical protein [Vicinamibacteria bacterium]
MSLLRRRVPGILPGACLALLCIYTCQKAAPVKVPPKNNATLVSAELPSALEPRQRVAVAVVMRNDGETTWSSEAFKLSAVGSDAAVWAASGFPWALPAGAAVAPGETVRFSFTLVAPDEEKDAHLMLQMQHGDAGVFGATTDYVVSVRGRNYASQPFFIALAQKVPLEEDGGGIFAHDLTGDGRMDFVVTSGDEVGAYEHNGNVLWVATPGVAGTHSDDLQGAHNPGAIAGDMDGDGECEV